MITIAKIFDFDAAHFLPLVPEGHKCRRMHGHTYRAEVRISVADESALDPRGMICDYAEIAAAWAPIHDLLDHRTLNDVPGLENPTTEVLAPWILRRLLRLCMVGDVSVRVYESASTWCEARPARRTKEDA
jgi:6-pyruvoyltetrahydropterin/6-carboxytetrahydropterin synthase